LIIRAALQVHATESALDPKELRKKKKIDAKELIAGDQGGQKFYVVLEDGSKQAVAFKALQSLEETVQKVCEKRGYDLNDYVVTSMEGRPLLLSTKMAEVKDSSIKFLKRGSAQIVGSVLSADKQKVLAELMGSTDTVVLSGKDIIAEEAEARAKRRLKEGPQYNNQADMSPALRELERQHKLLLKQLRVNRIKAVDKIEASEITQKDPGKVDPSNLTTVYVNLNTFSDKLGQRDQKHEPESFFQGLVKLPAKKDVEKIAKEEEKEEARSAKKGDDKDDDDDDDNDTGIQYPATFLIQLETGGRLQVPFQKNASVRSGIDKVAAKNNLKISEWMFVTLSGQPVDPDTTMGKVPGFSIMCVKKS